MKKLPHILLAKIFNSTRQTITRWQKEKSKPILDLLMRYFTRDELEEFLATNEIQKFENYNNNLLLDPEIIKYKLSHLFIYIKKPSFELLLEILKDTNHNNTLIQELNKIASQKKSKRHHYFYEEQPIDHLFLITSLQLLFTSDELQYIENNKRLIIRKMGMMLALTNEIFYESI